MTITENGRVDVDEETLARGRELTAAGRMPSKREMQKHLGKAWPTVNAVLTRLDAEVREAGERRRRESRRAMRRLASRKRPGSVRVSVPDRQRTVNEIALPVFPAPAVEPVAEVVPEAVEEHPVVEPVAVNEVRQGSAGALVGLAVSAAAAAAGGVWLAGPGLSWLSGPAAWVAVGVSALLVLSVLVWSSVSVVSRLFAGRSGRDAALDLASWAVAGVAGFLAAYGQVKFAQWAGVTGNMRFLVPGILEPSVVVLLLLANRRVKRRRAGFAAKPIGKLLFLAALLGGFAVYTNVVHAGGKAGLVFGAATVVGLILWWVKLQDDAAPDDWDDEPTSKRLSRKTSRYRPLRWLILFPQTRRAWLISLDHSISDAEVGLELARRWRREYELSRTAKCSRRQSRRNASARIDEHLVHEDGDR